MAEFDPETRMITLHSSENEEFKIERSVIRRAGTIDNVIINLNLDDPDAEDQAIPLPDISSDTLELVIKFCNHHANDPIRTGNEDDSNWVISEWDRKFLAIDQTPLYHLVLAANYLDIKCLLKASCRIVAEMVKGKTVPEMRDIYNITNDFTPEEEEQIKQENAWCERMASENRIIKLISNDGVEFEIQRNAIKRAVTIETLIIDLELDDAEGQEQSIPLPLVNSDTLRRVVEFCRHHAEDPIFTENEEEFNRMMSDWDRNFLDIDRTALYHLMLAANYLDIKCLLKAISRTIAEMVKGKSAIEMRRILNLVNDFTPEEEEQVRKENAWCEVP